MHFTEKTPAFSGSRVSVRVTVRVSVTVRVRVITRLFRKQMGLIQRVHSTLKTKIT